MLRQLLSGTVGSLSPLALGEAAGALSAARAFGASGLPGLSAGPGATPSAPGLLLGRVGGAEALTTARRQPQGLATYRHLALTGLSSSQRASAGASCLAQLPWGQQLSFASSAKSVATSSDTRFGEKAKRPSVKERGRTTKAPSKAAPRKRPAISAQALIVAEAGRRAARAEEARVRAKLKKAKQMAQQKLARTRQTAKKAKVCHLA